MRTHLLPILLLTMTLQSVQAQMPTQPQGEEEETELVLPEIVITVEDLNQESVEGLLPSDIELPIPELTLPLPEESALSLSETALPLPPANSDAPTYTSEAPEGRQTPVYSQGAIGAGSSNNVFGTLGLFKLGKDPRFSLSFLHEGLDGYWNGSAYRKAGAFTLNRTDRLDLDVRAQWGPGEFRMETHYREKEDGLQGVNTGGYQTLLFRQWKLAAQYGWAILPDQEFFAEASFLADTRVLTGQAPVSATELAPRIEAGWQIRWGVDDLVRLSVDAEWDTFNRSANQVQEVGLRTGVLGRWEFSPLQGTNLRGEGRILWDGSTRWYFPFQFSADSQWDIWSIGGSVIGESQPMTRNQLWEKNPLLPENSSLLTYSQAEQGWKAGLWGQGIFWESLKVKASVDFELWQSRFDPRELDPTTGLLNLTTFQGQTWLPSLALSWGGATGWSLGLGWVSAFGERLYWDFEHSLEGQAGYVSSDRQWGFQSKVEWLLTRTIPAPQWDLTVFTKLTEGIRLSMEVLDPLSLMMSAGRTGPGGYLRPGFQVKFLTQISL